jgi:WD40 repeat protein/serine/threonine protein kinase
MVDHFKIMRLIGRGGMGEVYLARDTRLGRKVALKVVHPEQIGSSEARESFLNEARAMAQLTHPHIVTVYAVGEHRGSPYVALEYLEGQNLRHRLREDRPGLREALRLALAVAEALCEAHRHKILHRDLKPENVLLPRDGRPRVVDFGLAKVLTVEEVNAARSRAPRDLATVDLTGPLQAQVTERSGIRGSPPYMAPEQWLDEPTSEATDIWALGIILHELVTGRRPFQESSLVTLCALVSSRDPTPLADSLREAPGAIADLIARALEKDPGRRPSAQELRATLEGQLFAGRGRLAEEQSPFRGLLPFTERYADFFFGRDAEIISFLERIREEPVVPVVGPSGAGKSSFIQAGVIPRLRDQGAWIVLSLRPGSEPFLGLASRLAQGESVTRGQTQTGYPTVSIRPKGRGALTPGRSGELEGLLTGGEQALAARLAETPSLLSLVLLKLAELESSRVLLFVDQLEELYTLVPDETVRRRFMQALCTAADDPQDPVRVVFTLRDDFLVRLAEGDAARRALEHVTVLRSPDAAALEEILVRPLEAVAYGYDDPNLVREMVAEVHGEPASLPLLQFVTRSLWDRRDRVKRQLLRSVYVELGGVAGSLARHADGVLEGLPATQVRLARAMLLRLVTDEGTRRTLPRSQVLHGLPDEAEGVLTRLTQSRMVTVRKARGDAGALEAELELAHESLISSWRTLARWVEESREELVFLAQIRQAAELWDRRGRRDEEVWQGDALREARRASEHVSAAIPEPGASFLRAGLAREARRASSRRLRLVAVVAGLALVAVVAVVVALALGAKEREASAGREQARRRWAEAQREAAHAALLRGDPLEARARLRGSIESEDSPLARALWWRLSRDPALWRKELGAITYDVVFSPDGRWVAAGCQDRAIYLVDLRTAAVRVLRGHDDQVFSVAFSPDGRQLASGSWSGQVRIWDLATSRSRVLGSHRSATWRILFARDGRSLYSCSNDRTIREWDVASGSVRRTLRGHTDSVRALALSADGRTLASGGLDRVILLWDLTRELPPRRLEGHKDRLNGLAFSPDGALLASASWDRTVRVWELATSTVRLTLAGHGAGVFNVCFSPDGARLASSSMDETVRIWEVATGAEQRVLRGHADGVWGLAFSADGHRLATSGLDRTVRLWNLDASAERSAPSGHSSAVFGVAFAPDGRRVASGGYDKTVRVWEVASGRVERALTGHTGVIYNVAFSPDSRRIASASADKTVRLWDVESGGEQRVLVGHQSSVSSVSFSPDGTLLASAGWDRVVRLWDAASGVERRVLRGHGDRVIEIAFSPDGTMLAASGTDKTIRLFHVATGALLRTFTGHAEMVYGVAFSPDGKQLASGSPEMAVRLWDVATGAELATIQPGTRVYWLDFHPDGKRLAAALSDGTARVWDVSRRPPVQLHTLRGHAAEVNHVRISRDGKLAVTTSDDGTVRLWELEHGRPFWRAPVLLADPPRFVSHRGWSLLTPGTATPAAATGWERAVAQARFASELPGSRLCARVDDDLIELWDPRTDRMLLRRRVPKVRAIAAVADGCAVLAGGEARLLAADGSERLLARGATAIAWDHGELLVASGQEVRRFGPRGEGGRLKGDVGVTALGRADGWIALGFENGNIELVPLAPGRARSVFSFEDVPSSPVVRLLEGPMGTLIAGFANGLLGIWSLENGTRLEQARLSGPVAHLLLRGERLHAVTELGDHLTLDLGIFRRRYCDLAREIWRSVPVVWEGGLPVLRDPPARHRCLRR